MSDQHQGQWERLQDTVRFVPARAKSHMAYFTVDHRRIVKDKDGVIHWEQRAGKPVYVRDLPSSHSDAFLAAQILHPLLEALSSAELDLGGPPE